MHVIIFSTQLAFLKLYNGILISGPTKSLAKMPKHIWIQTSFLESTFRLSTPRVNHHPLESSKSHYKVSGAFSVRGLGGKDEYKNHGRQAVMMTVVSIIKLEHIISLPLVLGEINWVYKSSQIRLHLHIVEGPWGAQHYIVLTLQELFCS